MVRIGLRDDFGQLPGAAVLTWAIPVGLDGDCGTGGCSGLPGAESPPDPDPGGRFPKFTIRARSMRYVDDDGIQRYAWATLHEGEVVLRDLVRKEVSDPGAQVEVTAVIELPAPEGQKPPRETATAWDESGQGWTVSQIEDKGTVWLLTIGRVDDGPKP